MLPSHACLEITEGNTPSNALLSVLSHIEDNNNVCELSSLLAVLIVESSLRGPESWAGEMMEWKSSRVYRINVDVLSRRLGISIGVLEEGLRIIGFQEIPKCEGYVHKLLSGNKYNVRMFSCD
jgi:hypothetical protein